MKTDLKHSENHFCFVVVFVVVVLLFVCVFSLNSGLWSNSNPKTPNKLKSVELFQSGGRKKNFYVVSKFSRPKIETQVYHSLNQLRSLTGRPNRSDSVIKLDGSLTWQWIKSITACKLFTNSYTKKVAQPHTLQQQNAVHFTCMYDLRADQWTVIKYGVSYTKGF